jgi:hypothetical protein
MNRSEDELKSALRRQEAPDGFTERVLARVAHQKLVQSLPVQSIPARHFWMNIFAQPVLRWGSVAAISAALLVGAIRYRQFENIKAQRERAEGEAAKQQLILALRIAGSKLQLAKSKVNEMNEDQTQNHPVKE